MLSKARTRLFRRIETRKGRKAEGVVLLEGWRGIETALAHGAELLCVLRTTPDHLASPTSPVRNEAMGAPGEISEEEKVGAHEKSRRVASLDLIEIIRSRGIEVIEVSEDLLAEFAQTEAPQGILALAKEPHSQLPSAVEGAGERVLLLDRIQDPGNVGTLIRTAAAFGVDRVLVLDGTADPWSAKALRASAGLAFHLPLHLMDWSDAAAWIDGAGLPLLVAHGPGEDVRHWLEGDQGAGLPRGKSWVLLVGNEGDGPRSEAFEKADTLLSIPLAEGVESLNAAMAGAILLWALGPGRARV